MQHTGKTRTLVATLALTLTLALSACSGYRVYSVQSRPSQKLSGGMVYALPRTLVRVAVTFERTDLSSAPYAPYADMLGLPTPDSLYHIASIEVGTTLTADPQHYYYVVPGRTPLSIDSRSLLLAIGEPSPEAASQQPETESFAVPSTPSPQPEYNLYDRTDTFYLRSDRPGSPSLVASKKDVRSLQMRAEAAAEQLQELQEKKQELLFGEYEGNYSGDAIRFIYSQLNAQEEQLTSLFSGTTRRETVVFLIDPQDEKTLIDSQSVLLFRFSPEEGLVEEGGEEVWCEVRCTNTMRNAARFVKHRTKTVTHDNRLNRSTFKYRIPETATVRIHSASFNFAREVKVSQFGTIANLPAGRCKAHFDPRTGALISYRR